MRSAKSLLPGFRRPDHTHYGTNYSRLAYDDLTHFGLRVCLNFHVYMYDSRTGYQLYVRGCISCLY